MAASQAAQGGHDVREEVQGQRKSTVSPDLGEAGKVTGSDNGDVPRGQVTDVSDIDVGEVLGCETSEVLICHTGEVPLCRTTGVTIYISNTNIYVSNGDSIFASIGWFIS